MRVEIGLPEIEGYEYTGEYRSPMYYEYWLSVEGTISTRKDTSGPYPILKKITTKRNITAKDLWDMGETIWVKCDGVEIIDLIESYSLNDNCIETRNRLIPLTTVNIAFQWCGNDRVWKSFEVEG